MTESSGGYIHANDGTAPAWFLAADVLRRSLDLPHDKVGHNGGSTGPLQQLSDDALAARGIGSYGWGSMADTMNPERYPLQFLAKLRITDDKVYRYVENKVAKQLITVDAVVADVLRVQQPLPSETASTNYRLAQVDLAEAMTAGGPRFWTDKS